MIGMGIFFLYLPLVLGNVEFGTKLSLFSDDNVFKSGVFGV